MSTIDQQFVEFIVKTLVSNPEKVAINRVIDEKGVLLSLSVDPEVAVVLPLNLFALFFALLVRRMMPATISRLLTLTN